MMRRSAAALIALALAAPIVAAQDTVASYRHVLSLDLSRVKPFQRSYDMIVTSGDSSYTIGQRDVSLAPATYAGNAAWLLVETRTGVVPAAESLYLAPDMRPIHWASSMGRARLGVEFVGDSLFGATTTPGGKHSILMPGRPDLLVSLAMIETLVPLLPLTASWSDSAATIAVDARSATIHPAELAVISLEQVHESYATVPVTGAMRSYYAIAVRTETSTVVITYVAETEFIPHVQQALPGHVGSVMQYRWKPVAPPVPPPLPPR